ncbi:MAG TPA: hypothetical protein VMZ26_13300 [Pyrinomonadaceae bacterium]|nr:hypothetical protein [Pyrinomonadaceae bacterium]
MIAKKISITTESRETFIVRRIGEFGVRGFCESCAGDGEMLTLDAAAVVVGRPTRELIREIDAGIVHSIETVSGRLLVCAASLFNDLKSSSPQSHDKPLQLIQEEL